MKGQALIVGWIAMGLVMLAALVGTVAQTMALGRLSANANLQRAGLARELEASRQNIQAELLKDIRWTPDRTTASDFLRRLADLAQGGQAKVLAIAPLEQEPASRYRKSSHRIDMTASFRELLGLVTRVEREGGILEDIVLETPQAKPGQETGSDGVRAQFRLTTIEPTDDTRRIMERVVAAGKQRSKLFLAAAFTLPIDARAEAAPLLRDPFRLAEAPVRRAPSGVVAPAPARAPASVQGIMKFPGGALAIVDQQIVSVGDVVNGGRVVAIVDGRIVLSEPSGGSRSIPLADFAGASATRR